MWQAETFKRVAVLSGHTNGVKCLLVRRQLPTRVRIGIVFAPVFDTLISATASQSISNSGALFRWWAAQFGVAQVCASVSRVPPLRLVRTRHGHDCFTPAVYTDPGRNDFCRCVSLSDDQTIRIWDILSLTSPPECIAVLEGHTGGVLSMVVAGQGVPAAFHSFHPSEHTEIFLPTASDSAMRTRVFRSHAVTINAQPTAARLR